MEQGDVIKMTVIAATSLAGHYNAGWAAVAGAAGGLAFLVVVTMGRAVGMTRMNFLQVLGTMIAPNASDRAVYSIGLSAHLMASAAFGLGHAAILTGIGVTSVGGAAGWDLLIGAAHGLVILAVLPMMLKMMHPLVRKHAMDDPGLALTGFGRATPIGSLMAHVAFGLVVGTVYAAAIL
jgi:hypothetical protein